MIKQRIECEWPRCEATQLEAEEGAGFPGWGHLRGAKLDGVERDLHLCPQHLGDIIKTILEAKNGMD